MERGVSSHVKVGKKPVPDQVTSMGEDYRVAFVSRHGTVTKRTTIVSRRKTSPSGHQQGIHHEGPSHPFFPAWQVLPSWSHISDLLPVVSEVLFSIATTGF